MFEDIRSIFRRRQSQTVQGESSDPLEISGPISSAINPKTRIIAIVNQKGGCGKTTTCINLAAGLAKRGLKVLIIDLDPQSHSSLGLGLDTHNLNTSVYDALVKGTELDRVITPTYLQNLDIAPSTSLLTGAQLEIADLLGRESLLRTSLYRMLNTNVRYYDYVFLDNSPSLNLITINGLAAAQHVLIPIQAHYFSLEGMRELYSTIKIVKERINAELNVLGILPTIFDSRTKISREVLSQLRDYFGNKVLTSVIRMNITLADASAHGQSIFDHDPGSNGAKDYEALAAEIVQLTRPELVVSEPTERPAEVSVQDPSAPMAARPESAEKQP